MQDRAFWRVRRWCAEAEVCSTKFYKLPVEQRPLTTVIGGMPVIVESPRDWVLRLAREQGTTAFDVPSSPAVRRQRAAAGKISQAAQRSAKASASEAA